MIQQAAPGPVVRRVIAATMLVLMTSAAAPATTPPGVAVVFGTNSSNNVVIVGPGAGIAAGDSVTVTYGPAAGGAPITTAPVIADAAGIARIIIPPNVGSLAVAIAVTVSGSPGPGKITRPGLGLLATLDPPNSVNQTRFTVDAASSASAGGAVFALAGSFAAIDDQIDAVVGSPTYGRLGGSVVGSLFNVTGIGPAGNLALLLDSNQPFDINVGHIWTMLDGSLPANTSLNLPISGTVIFNGIPSAFTGSVQGQIDYLSGNRERLVVTFDLLSGFGPISGTLIADGQAGLIPTPGAMSLLIVAAAATRTRRRPTSI